MPLLNKTLVMFGAGYESIAEYFELLIFGTCL